MKFLEWQKTAIEISIETTIGIIVGVIGILAVIIGIRDAITGIRDAITGIHVVITGILGAITGIRVVIIGILVVMTGIGSAVVVIEKTGITDALAVIIFAAAILGDKMKIMRPHKELFFSNNFQLNAYTIV